MNPIFRIALRNVLRNTRRSLITLSAVLLAVGVIVAVRGLLNGLQATLQESIVNGQTGAIQVHRKGYLKSMQGGLDLDLPADAAFLDKITAVPGVTAAAARINFGGMVNAHDTTVFAMFVALDPAREFKVCPERRDSLGTGRLIDPASPTGTDFTSELMRRIGVKQGDTVALLSNDREGVLNAAEVPVTGTLTMNGLPLPEKKIAWLPLGVAQALLRMEGRATEVAVAVDDLKHLDAIAAAIRTAVGADYEVSTWHEVAAFVDDLIRTQDAFMGIIIYTFLVVALIGIANAMLMNVLERTREIGTMMAVGMRRRQILRLFLAEAALLGLSGGIAGALAGGAAVFYYAAHPLHFPVPGGGGAFVVRPFIAWAFVLRTFALAAGGAALASLYPALIASRLRPIEALSRS